ncbi:hypothetical protein I4U23_020123 [Adineta vaga]|nr:hypothetical protein I4U23_020123 [Adineta vaga]
MEPLGVSERLIHRTKFIVASSLEAPAILFSLLIFVFFITNRIHLQKLQHQALLVLLIVNFIQLSINMPMVIHFFRLGRISPETSTYCKLWMYVESTLDCASASIVAIMSIQRHTLVFHFITLRIRFNKYIYYYLPLLLGITYPMIFYLATVVFYPCDDTQWNFTLNMCGDKTCYLSNDQILATFDWIVNTGLPVVVIIIGNVALIVRVIRQKLRRQQSVSWVKQRRMTLQLLSISCLYLIAWLPSIISGLMQQIVPSESVYGIQEDYISDLTYLISLLLPWLCIGLVPDFKKWLLKQIRRIKRPSNTIGIGTMT